MTDLEEPPVLSSAPRSIRSCQPIPRMRGGELSTAASDAECKRVCHEYSLSCKIPTAYRRVSPQTTSNGSPSEIIPP